jgi:hypothetical protein
MGKDIKESSGTITHQAKGECSVKMDKFKQAFGKKGISFHNIDIVRMTVT